MMILTQWFEQKENMCEKESTGQNIEMNNKYDSITIMGRNFFLLSNVLMKEI